MKKLRSPRTGTTETRRVSAAVVLLLLSLSVAACATAPSGPAAPATPPPASVQQAATPPDAPSAPPAATAAAPAPPAPAPAPSADAVPAPTGEHAAIREIRDFVRERMAVEGVVGMTVGFSRGDFVWVEGFGHADLENDVAAKPESSYRMASVTKPMTAVGVLTLVEDGKIDLDAEVQEYAPYFPRKEHPITVRQLLAHLGGISHYRDYDAEGHFKEPKTTRESIAVFADFDLVAEPGTRYSYTTYGYNLLGAVIETASGRSYGEYMTDRVWGPLGMESTRMDDPRELIPHRVQGYELVDGELRRSEYLDISSRFAGGGTRSTVPDMLRFARGLDEGEVLSDETRRLMWTGATTRDERRIGYGLGWSTGTGNGRFVVGHGGSQAETTTFLLSAPSLDFAVAVASNYENVDPSVYARRIFEIVLGEPWEIRHFARTAEERTLLRALDAAFDAGMHQLDRHGRPATADEGELAAAFRYLADALAAPREDAARRLEEGVHPVAGEPFVLLVSHVGDSLRASGAELDDYHRRGPIALFHDYVEWYRGRPGHPDALRFPPELEARLDRWDADWQRTWTDETRGLELHAGTDLERLAGRLAATFRGASVYPDYTEELGDAVRDLVVRGETGEAVEVAQAAVEIYPESDAANADLGVLHLLMGDDEQAAALLARAHEIDPDGAASAGSLNTIAYQLAGLGQPEAGLQVLEAAVRMHPEVANLYDSMGEFHHRMGNRQKALELYSRALEVDPDFANAENARRIVEELRSAEAAGAAGAGGGG